MKYIYSFNTDTNLQTKKTAGHKITIVGEPCNIDANTKILLYLRLCYANVCVYTCTVHTYFDRTVVL